MTHPDHLDPRDAVKLRELRSRDGDFNRLVKHVRAFAIMMTGRHGDRLDAWITTVEHDTLAPLAGFARNLRRDLDAVRNGARSTGVWVDGGRDGESTRVQALRCPAGARSPEGGSRATGWLLTLAGA
jgi:hypothetical protein